VTYPKQEIADYVNENFVAWRVNYNTETRLLRRFIVFWTPTLIFLDPKGNEHYRLLGFLPPDLFVIHLIYARAMIAFTSRKYEQSAELFETIANDYPHSEEAPQAVYFRGVARYKATEDDAYLDETASELSERFPGSEWAMRASIW